MRSCERKCMSFSVASVSCSSMSTLDLYANQRCYTDHWLYLCTDNCNGMRAMRFKNYNNSYWDSDVCVVLNVCEWCRRTLLQRGFICWLVRYSCHRHVALKRSTQELWRFFFLVPIPPATFFSSLLFFRGKCKSRKWIIPAKCGEIKK